MASHSRFHLADLQVHSTDDESHSYGNHASDVEFAQALARALAAAGVSVIALSDHLSLNSYEAVAAAGADHNVYVFPAFEASIQGCHLIAIFDRTDPALQQARALLASLLRPGETPKRQDGGYRPITKYGLQEFCKEVRDAGGLVIAPHSTESEIGFFASRVVLDKSDICSGGLVAAYDMWGHAGRDVLTNPAVHFGERRPAWILTGDMRSLDNAGKRAVWLKLDHPPTLEGLRQAFLAPESRIVIPASHQERWGKTRFTRFKDSVDPDWARIASVRVAGGFHDGVAIEFAPGLNALIGGKGTGKSALVEALRHGLELRTAFDESLQKTRESTLPNNAELFVTVVSGTGEHYEIRRSGGTKPKSAEVYRDGKLTELSVQQRFTATIYGQHELRRLAEPATLREFVQETLVSPEWSEASRNESKLLNDLGDLADQLAAIEAGLGDLDDLKAELADVRDRLNAAREVGIADLTAKLKKIAEEDALVDQAKPWSQQIREHLDEARLAAKVPDLPSSDAAVGLRTAYQAGADELTIATGQALEALDGVVEAVNAATTQWDDAREAHTTKIKGQMSAAGITDVDQFEVDQQRESRLVLQIEGAEKSKKEVALLQQTRTALLSELESVRREQSRLVERAVAALNDQLTGRVRLTHSPGADYAEVIALLQEAAPNSRGTTLCRFAKNAGGARQIVDAARESASKLTALGLTESAAAKLASVPDRVMRRLEEARVADLIELELNRGTPDDPKWRVVEEVSPGQRATALLTLVMIAGEDPLIIDQPEDDLDNRYIFEEVVANIRAISSKRQVIVATHNANIPVLGDAELVIAFDATADQSSILAMGGLEDPDVSVRSREILEGGDEAFNARQERYAGGRS